MLDEQLEQGELLRSQRHRSPPAVHPAAAEIDLEVRNPMQRRRQRRRAARQGLEPRYQLADGERLGQVIVRPGLEPAHAVVHGVESGQHQDGGRHAAAAQLGAQVQSSATRQAHVENDDVERGSRGVLEPRDECRGQRRVDALPAQAVAQQPSQLRIVLDDQHPHRRRSAAAIPTARDPHPQSPTGSRWAPLSRTTAR